ncbi:Redox-sensitive transcriptional activator SoxR [Planctomycetes bacterium Poly30]|uniref:Redox-sensitive transcriptional activator SoxR n=1 Tax=Saltatorellus ferox TaxID=2528018 RepID=A0A518EMG3_9BACT|nr:Redox-sensitive transcriptional activator SoxR [Planctomycetes bacterium Poly30]
MATSSTYVTIGELAERTGVATSALRFYESKGLLAPSRTASGQRRFLRSDIRRVSFILITQALGYSLTQIAEQLEALPESKSPTRRDWERLARIFQTDLDDRIQKLESLRDRLTSCIGCGCLSLKVCNIYNGEDVAAEKGAGPRYLLGDSATECDSASTARVRARGVAPNPNGIQTSR